MYYIIFSEESFSRRLAVGIGPEESFSGRLAAGIQPPRMGAVLQIRQQKTCCGFCGQGGEVRGGSSRRHLLGSHSTVGSRSGGSSPTVLWDLDRKTRLGSGRRRGDLSAKHPECLPPLEHSKLCFWESIESIVLPRG